MSDRLVGIAFLPHLRQRASYRESDDDALVWPGLDEALARQHVVAPAPAKSSPLWRAAARMMSVARALRGRDRPRQLPATADFAHVATTHEAPRPRAIADVAAPRSARME